MTAAGKALILAGLIVIVVGAVLLVAGKANLPLGRLPGDIAYKGRNFTFYFPLATSIILSLVLSLVVWFFSRR
jgi:heme/copper-type cytochrome/quinol oxidase subunit 2